MNISLFKETVSQHTKRLREEGMEDEYVRAMAEAHFYSENSLKQINTTISLFKEKASKCCTDVLFNEGLKDIGSAIWKALVNIGRAIVRIAINIRMMFIGGEKSLVKRLLVVKDKIKAMKDNEVASVTIPVKKGGKGFADFDNLMDILLDLTSGNAFLKANISSSGVLEWDVDSSEKARLDRVEKFNSLQAAYHTGKAFGTGAMSLFVKEIAQDGSLLDVFAAPARLYSVALGSKNTMVDALMGNKADLDTIEKFVNGVKANVAKYGVTGQIMKRLGVRGTESKLSGIIDYVNIEKASKRDILSSIDGVIKSVNSAFAKTKNGGGVQSTEYNFEGCMKQLIKDVTSVTKHVKKKSKDSDNIDAEIMTRVHAISKASTTVMNVVLRDYMNMAASTKLILSKMVKGLEKTTSDIKPVVLDVNMTDSFSAFYQMAGGDKNAK